MAAHRIALASVDGLTVHKHFGAAEDFLVYDIDDGAYAFVEQRKVVAPCEAGSHSIEKFDAALLALSDCEAVFVGKIGPGASEYLAQRGVRSFEAPGTVELILKNVIERKVLDRFGRG